MSMTRLFCAFIPRLYLSRFSHDAAQFVSGHFVSQFVTRLIPKAIAVPVFVYSNPGQTGVRSDLDTKQSFRI